MPPTRPHENPSRAPWLIIGAGAAVVAIGGVLDATWYSSARTKLANDVVGDMNFSDDHDAWHNRRNVVIGCYAGGAVVIGVGLVLARTIFKVPDEAPAVSFVPDRGGGLVTVGWTR